MALLSNRGHIAKRRRAALARFVDNRLSLASCISQCMCLVLYVEVWTVASRDDAFAVVARFRQKCHKYWEGSKTVDWVGIVELVNAVLAFCLRFWRRRLLLVSMSVFALFIINYSHRWGCFYFLICLSVAVDQFYRPMQLNFARLEPTPYHFSSRVAFCCLLSLQKLGLLQLKFEFLLIFELQLWDLGRGGKRKKSQVGLYFDSATTWGFVWRR